MSLPQPTTNPTPISMFQYPYDILEFVNPQKMSKVVDSFHELDALFCAAHLSKNPSSIKQVVAQIEDHVSELNRRMPNNKIEIAIFPENSNVLFKRMPSELSDIHEDIERPKTFLALFYPPPIPLDDCPSELDLEHARWRDEDAKSWMARLKVFIENYSTISGSVNGYFLGSHVPLQPSMFFDCRKLKIVNIPTGATSVPHSCFMNCFKMNSITIPIKCVEIWEKAFKSCRSIRSVQFPVSCTLLGPMAFNDCNKLTTVTFADATTIRVLEHHVFAETHITTFYVPSSVKIIDDGAFNQCDHLQSVTFGIESLLDSVGERAFYHCHQMTSIILPSGVRMLGDASFSKCLKLTGTVLPSDSRIKSIGQAAFQGCSSLNTIYFPKRCLEVDFYTFSACSSLREVIFHPKSMLHRIRVQGFAMCMCLKSICIPDSCVVIDKFAFSDCENLAVLEVQSKNHPNKIIQARSFEGCKLITRKHLSALGRKI